MALIDKWLTRLDRLMWFLADQPDESIDHPLQDECNEYA
jgi:hypothetical protein